MVLLFYAHPLEAAAALVKTVLKTSAPFLSTLLCCWKKFESVGECSKQISLIFDFCSNFNRVWWYTKEVLPYGVEDFQKLTCPLWLVEDLGCPAVVLDGLAASGPMG
ncbi:uncharacterized protein LOC125222682 isoform X1 [Salvia hispanica]|uniref:uncharacterized protein LOC125197892 isoform X1 n=1 Tax=Salvia hispanica TaxID=49212 RepID=UPI002009A5E5|nr:uncharacterized protein LOC125197892 isoform X1 [Salvia hispanica]XP_047952363.1 uncharacterized protein LOC125197892 isoform X1 [Salvia hispanica]XP_047981384.1 uncharacterized protein LOC125222682 isoform X1 [Salvia hispanica]XP_047981385.1 uncharacterized protein LOC125222682 isoform X1 [Salvia hispanica]